MIGRSGSGKSTLVEHLIAQFLTDYRKSQILVCDSKPRFKAQYQMNGMNAASLYKRWDHGAELPGSMLLQHGVNPKDQFRSVWKHQRTALCQTTNSQQIGFSVECIKEFIESARAGIPRLIVIDEGLDFFHRNAIARGGDDAILRAARAGRERGIALIFGSQRTYGIPLQIMSELTKLYGFALDYVKDATRLQEFGYPVADGPLPDDDFVFRYWSKKQRKVTPVLMRLDMRKAA